MNLQAIRIMFLKDLFLCRRFLFAYFVAGASAAAVTTIPNATVSFVGLILVLTVAIASGIHFIGNLLLAETTDQTRLFVMSLPINLLEYSIGKISVVMTTFLIPWTAMFSCLTICAFAAPGSKHGSVVVIPAIFLFLFAGFTLQLVIAVVTESAGCTICMMVACNVGLNVFMMKLFSNTEVIDVTKGDVVIWPAIIWQTVFAESIVIAVALVLAFVLQTRKRDLI